MKLNYGQADAAALMEEFATQGVGEARTANLAAQ